MGKNRKAKINFKGILEKPTLLNLYSVNELIQIFSAQTIQIYTLYNYLFIMYSVYDFACRYTIIMFVWIVDRSEWLVNLVAVIPVLHCCGIQVAIQAMIHLLFYQNYFQMPCSLSRRCYLGFFHHQCHFGIPDLNVKVIILILFHGQFKQLFSKNPVIKQST